MNKSLARLALFAGAAVILDQLGKAWARAELPRRGIIQLVQCCCELRLLHNRGAFFGLGSHLPEALRRNAFVVGSLVIIALMLRLLRRSSEAERTLRWALTLLCAGAAGNLIDRVRTGEVTDFVHLHLGDIFHWATFNFADVLIAAGLVSLLWYLRAASGGAGQAAPRTNPPHA
ncbi:MAG TPA: signal peptidase II [Polyangiales bacterium]